jgi:hypothetical protein
MQLDSPIIAHVLPLGRLRWNGGEDRLAFAGDRVGELIPPAFPDLYARFIPEGVEFIDDPKANWNQRNIWITWFRSGGVEVRTHVGLERVLHELLPFLGEAAAAVLEVAPPFLVSLTLSHDGMRAMQEASRTDSGLRLLPVENHRGNVMLPPTVLESARDFGELWGKRAEWLMNQAAQAFGHPAFPHRSAPAIRPPE